jgi:hypothetical protein
MNRGELPMNVYVATTGAIFGLITIAHLARLVVEPHTRGEPVYLVLTVAAAGLCGWAGWLLWRSWRG